MGRIKNLLLYAMVLLCLFVGWWTAQDNPQEIAIQLLGFRLPAWSLGAWLILVFAAGVVLGILASMPMIMRFRAENRRLKRHQ